MCDIIIDHLPVTIKTPTFGDRKISGQGTINAQLDPNEINETEFRFSKDYKYLLRRYRTGQEKGSPDARAILDEVFAHGRGVPRDYKEAVKWLHKSAEQAEAKTQYKLGLMYEEGKGVSLDYKEAVRWFRKVAERGDAKAQYKTGLMYESGKGVLPNGKEAERWFRKAACQEHKKAQFHLGLMYAKGLGVHQDYVLAHTWFHIAGSEGNKLAIKAKDMVEKELTSSQIAESQYLLGQAYSRGIFVDKDYDEAIELLRKAAEEGHAGSQCLLGELFADKAEQKITFWHSFPLSDQMREDNLDSLDRREAIKWHLKAAEQGFAKAQFNLGLMYGKGKVIHQDYVLAYIWFDIAGSDGNKIAIKARDVIEKEMTSSQIAEAQELSRE